MKLPKSQQISGEGLDDLIRTVSDMKTGNMKTVNKDDIGNPVNFSGNINVSELESEISPEFNRGGNNNQQNSNQNINMQNSNTQSKTMKQNQEQEKVNLPGQSFNKAEKFNSKLSELFNFAVNYEDLEVNGVIFTVRTLDSSAYLSEGFELIVAEDFDSTSKISDLMRKSYKYLVRALVKITTKDGEVLNLEEIAGCSRTDVGFYKALESALLKNIPFPIISELVLKYVDFYSRDLNLSNSLELAQKKS